MMFSILWLFLWVVNDTPNVDFSPVNSWAIGLIACIVIDIFK